MKIVYKTETGIAVITPARSLELAMKDIPKGAEYKIVEDEELPKDRVFRNAWKYDLKEDISKSKEIWKDKLRADRKPLLEALDIEYQRADEDGDSTKKSDIVAQKNVLRDITNKVNEAKTIAGIKKIAV